MFDYDRGALEVSVHLRTELDTDLSWDWGFVSLLQVRSLLYSDTPHHHSYYLCLCIRSSREELLLYQLLLAHILPFFPLFSPTTAPSLQVRLEFRVL